MAWLVFGTLFAVFAAEMYVLFNQEEKIGIDEQEDECACKCHCCHCHKENKEEE